MAKTKATILDSDRSGKIYREFTRIKFKKYKLQFPRMRDSEIITKIIREWEALNEEEKLNLESQFVERSGSKFLEDEGSSSSKRRRQLEKLARLDKSSSRSRGRNNSSEKRSSPKVRVFEEKKPPTPKSGSEIRRSEGKNSGKKSTPDKESSSNQFLGKTQQIIKKSKTKSSKKQEYWTFFKYYYERLSAEHPRWNKNQISTIIKLMWRKRIKTTKRGDGRVRKGLSGRQLYRRQKESEGFLKDTCYSMWKSLPFEGKIYWNIKAQGKPQRSKRNGKEINKCLNKGASKPEENLTEVPQTNLSFMERTIHQ